MDVIEIMAGKYAGTRWREGSLFIGEDAFTIAEGVVARHAPSYERHATNDIPKDIGRRIVSEWREVAEWLPVLKPDEARVALNVASWIGASSDDALVKHRTDVIQLLRGLADGCEDFYSREEWICVLGLSGS